MNEIEEIKDVLLNREELLAHGCNIGQKHRLKKRKESTKRLKKRLEENYNVIFDIYKKLDSISKDSVDMATASEWLMDNFYKIEEQVKDARLNIDHERFYRLNALASGYLRDYPRVYSLALEYVSHTDGSIDTNLFIDFIKAYQSNQILTISEVWALSLVTRIALVENIRIICTAIYDTQLQWNKAEQDLKLNNDELLDAIEESLEIRSRLNTPYIEHMLACIRRSGVEFGEIYSYLEKRLDEYNTTIGDLVQYGHKEYAVRKVSLGNSITSLHSISTMDWNDIFESISIVEEKLSKDPAGIYSLMDFESRDYYRKAIAKISRSWGVSETRIANIAISLSKAAKDSGKAFKATHVGYYLIDEGRQELFSQLKIKKGESRLKSIASYIVSIISLTALFIIFGVNMMNKGWSNEKILLLSALLLIPASEIGVSLANYIFMKLYKPAMLPRLEYGGGIPDEARTMVIIPALLSDKKSARELIEKMEVYYLANKDKNVFFGLVGDFKDYKAETNPDDKAIIDTVMAGVKHLNEKYDEEGGIKFYYFHRKREYNPKQGKWMGWERKRGAIIHFNNLITGRPNTSFIYKSSDTDALKDIRYIITIDSDTNLVMDSARKLIGTISHPLNRAVYDPDSGVVADGYGIIQPRIEIDIMDSQKTLFAEIFAGDGGIDPYTTAVSNIYQDVFGEGIFTGKGIYDLKLFNEVTEKRIEDNTILSHDLLEGSLLRTGLAGDISLIDGFPGKYGSYSARQHRWVRGDWQLIKWIFGKKPLSALSRWKMIDNLRRSMLQPSLYLLLLGTAFLPVAASKLLYIILLIILFPHILRFFSLDIVRNRDVGRYTEQLKTAAYQLFIILAFLPYNAYLMADAIVRTLYRVFYSRKNLLEWLTAADAEKKIKLNFRGCLWKMRQAPALSLLYAAAIAISGARYDAASVFFIILWIASPYIAYRISNDSIKQKPVLSGEDRENIERIGRNTWSYYEKLVCKESNFLPPDNYQEYPLKGAAPRTSPTNIGLYMVSTLAAVDLGYITMSQALERLNNTMDTVEKLESWKGHLYNWYDIKTLEVLRPHYVSTVDSGNFISYMLLLEQALSEPLENSDNRSTAADMKERIGRIIERTKFIYLYDKKKNLFSIGYDVDKESLTNSYYDLLASEARITSYLAAARREVPLKHWNKLGRSLTHIGRNKALVSWSGTMFEYFMPALIMKDYSKTIMDETYKGVIKAQKSYGRKNNVPWGTSESGYYAFDLDLNYQYKAFGVPDLGLKRGLVEEVVISPYSTILAINFDPEGAAENIRRLIEMGMEGKYGLYEAVDFTLRRMPAGANHQIIKSYMAHHQGMSLLAINNYLNDDILIKRFHSHPVIKAGEIMLQERIPANAVITKEYKESMPGADRQKRLYQEGIRSYDSINALPPPCQILTNGKHSVFINNRGGGFSKIDGTLINRWRADSIEGGYGNYIFIRDLSKDKVWSAAYEPFNEDAEAYNVDFYQSKAEFTRTDNDIKTVMEVFVSPEDHVEIRRIRIENHGHTPVSLELTSFMEITLTAEAADIAHRAFSNLFVRTEHLEEYKSLLAVSIPRETDGRERWAFHTSVVEGDASGSMEYETSRMNFIGRGRSIKNPLAVHQPLSNTSGIVLDPVMSIRRVVRLNAGSSGEISFVTGFGMSRERMRELIVKYREVTSIQRAYALSATRSQVEGSYLNLDTQDIVNFEKLISHLIYGSPGRSENREHIRRNRKGQPSLWSYGISGDLPIMLISITDERDIHILRQAVRAHEFLRIKGLSIDLVILNLDESNYLQPLRTAILNLVEDSCGRYLLGTSGGVFIINASNISCEDKDLLIAASALTFKAEKGPIEKQLLEISIRKAENRKEDNGERTKKCELPAINDAFMFNGYGGFVKDGSEYVMNLKNGRITPAPWVNVIANPKFGFIISESGGGYAWAENSREYKITSWTNDPVADEPQEIIYMEDMEKEEIWTITPSASKNAEPWAVRHGWGYTVFNMDCYGIKQELEMFTPLDEKLKVNILKLKNKESRRKKLKLYYYVEPVLGVNKKETKPHIVIDHDAEFDGLILRNSYNSDFPGRAAFMASSEPIKGYKTNRLGFLNMAEENAYEDIDYEACGVIQIEISLGAMEEKKIGFYLGQSSEYKEIKAVLERYKDISTAEHELKMAKQSWQAILGKIKVETPDKSMDLLLNGWLAYQTISCRLWARSGFYQSGGAYGFRDQLQDAVNIGMLMPDSLKEQILLHCSHQFEEGDVQHWWHPVAGDKGVRTRFTDDLLWLPYAVIEYIKLTEDNSVLKIERPYIKAEPLKEGEDEKYVIPQASSMMDTVYGHCTKAIDRSLNFGIHDLPKMGSGDWNDGMNMVGNKGSGESIWLAFFLYKILEGFIPICTLMRDSERAIKYEAVMDKLKKAIEDNGWDGNWYKRAYYDDGTPLGSSENMECMIDSIAQSWAVLSGAAAPERASIAMESVKRHLVKEDEGLILLFTPPFDKTDKNPGYIKSYVPGVRENGGQYTHAAAWVICAFARLGEGNMAHKLFHMINPINHARTPLECAVYKTEPYAVAADVYAAGPHIGRGGWSWYTGAAGWIYRAGIEYILGIKRRGSRLFIEPCIPQDWHGYKVTYNNAGTIYNINVLNPESRSLGVASLSLDGKLISNKSLELIDDKKIHEVVVLMGCKE